MLKTEIFEAFESQLTYADNQNKLSDLVAVEPLPLDKRAIKTAHSVTISASNAHKIMGKLSEIALTANARAYIESMARGDVLPDITTPSMRHGIDTEHKAVTVLSDHLKEHISCTNADQQRFYHGDFISALPDGVIYHTDKLTAVVEIKCLDTENHERAFGITNNEQLQEKEWAKYCQVQTQLLCTSAPKAILAFYDPRHATPLHTVSVYPDTEWRNAFLVRAEQAYAYYQTLITEDDSNPAFTVSDQPAPDIDTLPRVQIDIGEVFEHHHEPEVLVKKIQQQAGSFVFDMGTAKGRDACRSHSANIIKCISPALTASKTLATDAKRVIEADLYFRKNFEKGVREIADTTRKPLTAWEAEQERLAEEVARLEVEQAEQQQLEQQLLVQWDAALVDNELYDLRKEKAEREANERAERERIERADHERKLQEQAVERERERSAETQRQREAAQQAELERVEREKQEVIAKAEREKQEATERTERERSAAEQAAKAREEAAIAEERRRQDAQRKKEAEEHVRIKAEEAKNAANRAHRQRVNKEIVTRLSAIGVDEGWAKIIITSANKLELGALVINY